MNNTVTPTVEEKAQSTLKQISKDLKFFRDKNFNKDGAVTGRLYKELTAIIKRAKLTNK